MAGEVTTKGPAGVDLRLILYPCSVSLILPVACCSYGSLEPCPYIEPFEQR